MTLVITQANAKHIIMVGDSALTRSFHDNERQYSTGCQKVQYARKAQVGISMWGAAYITERGARRLRIDRWISEFIEANDADDLGERNDEFALQGATRQTSPVDVLAKRLADRLNEIDRFGVPKDRHRGFHVAGYVRTMDGAAVPHVYHVRPDESDGYYECHAYLDYPDGVADAGYARILGGGKFTLRNGYYPMYNPVMKFMDNLAKDWRELENLNWPQDTTDDMRSFLTLQVMFIAQAVRVAKNGGEVDSQISSLSILPDGTADYRPQPMMNEDDIGSAAASGWFV